VTNEKERKDITKRPKQGAADAVHTIVRAGVSAIPVVGGPIKEIFTSLFAPPIVKRREEWIESIAEKLQELEKEFDSFKLENLKDSKNFITVVMHATTIAIRTHQEEKLDALRNAILNSAVVPNPDEDLQGMFLDCIDTLTPSHLRVLKFFENPRTWFQQKGIGSGNFAAGPPSAVLERAFPEFRRDFYEQLVKDLSSRGLMQNAGSLHVMMTEQGMFDRRTTAMGQSFLKYISYPSRNT